MAKMIILLVVSLAAILFLFYQVSGHFKKDEREQMKTMARIQKRGYYFTFIGVCLISIILLYALVIAVLLIFNAYSHVSEAEDGFLKLIGSLFFHSLSIHLFINLICFSIIINCGILYVLLRFSTPTRLLENMNTAAAVTILLGVLSLLVLRILNDPLVYGTETSLFLSEPGIAGGFSEKFDESIFKPIFIALNIIGPLLIIIGGIFMNISNRQQTKEN